jgi:hypothetical protein
MFRWCSYFTRDTPIGLSGLLRVQFYIFIFRLCSYLIGKISIGLHGLLRGYLYFLYGDVFRTSQETYLCASIACDENTSTFYIKMMFVPHGKYIYGPPRPVTRITLLFLCRWFSYLTGKTSMGLHWLLGDSFTFLYAVDVCTSQETHISLHGLLREWLYLLYVIDVSTSDETHLWASTRC